MTLKSIRSLTNLIFTILLISMTSGSLPVRAEENEEHEEREHHEKSKAQPVSAENTKWRAECGTCHIAYPPGEILAQDDVRSQTSLRRKRRA